MTTKKAPARRLEAVALDALIPADRNAKAHDEELIKGSLSRFGYIESIVLDERTGKIIAGHGRRQELLTARESGEEPPEGIELGPKGEWLVPVLRGWASKDDTEADAAAIALNRVGERGGWDRATLSDILEEIALTTENGFDGLGYGADDLLELQRELGELADRDSAFLDELAGDGEKPPNPLQGEGGGGITGGDVVELRVPMVKAERDEAMLLIRKHQRALDAESMAATLLSVLRTWSVPVGDEASDG